MLMVSMANLDSEKTGEEVLMDDAFNQLGDGGGGC